MATLHLSICGAMLAAALPFAAVHANADSSEKSPSAWQGDPTDEVIVEGTKPQIERRVYEFVSGITDRGYAVESLARWGKPICPLVAGLPRDQGEFILQRLSQAVLAAGAPLAPRNCRANFYIVLTSEPDKLLQLWGKRDHRLFSGVTSARVERFLNTPGPIRAWYKTESACAVGTGGVQQVGINGKLGSFDGVPDCPIEDTRLKFNYINVLSSVIVIVDPEHIKQVGLGPLTDYIAMVGLAKLDPYRDLGDAPTVLRLFAASADAVPKGMSNWDRAFLKALYTTSQRSRFQRSAITDRMVLDFSSR
jgi:hypothetical protein